jgi:hypothetical protein
VLPLPAAIICFSGFRKDLNDHNGIQKSVFVFILDANRTPFVSWRFLLYKRGL